MSLCPVRVEQASWARLLYSRVSVLVHQRESWIGPRCSHGVQRMERWNSQPRRAARCREWCLTRQKLDERTLHTVFASDPQTMTTLSLDPMTLSSHVPLRLSPSSPILEAEAQLRQCVHMKAMQTALASAGSPCYAKQTFLHARANLYSIAAG
jgi:hypothetical protein